MRRILISGALAAARLLVVVMVIAIGFDANI
jgi:hypothetical protein